MKRYHVVISDIAQESIEDHAELLGKIAIPAKRKFLRGVYAEIARLSRLPLSNPLANNQRLASCGVRCRLYRQGGLVWSILFVYEETHVLVIEVHDCRAMYLEPEEPRAQD